MNPPSPSSHPLPCVPRSPDQVGSALAFAAKSLPLPRFVTASWAAEIGIFIALTLLFPFLIHVIPVPEDSRLGARLLPMFYAPLLAALLGRPRTALIVAVVAPWLNWLLTGHPRPASGLLMTLQLLAFVGVVRALLARLGPRWFLALPAYLAAMLLAALVATVVPPLIGGAAAWSWLAQSVVRSLPGVAVLVALNWLVVRLYPPGPSGGPPAAA